jgi:hypothetical protein
VVDVFTIEVQERREIIRVGESDVQPIGKDSRRR